MPAAPAADEKKAEEDAKKEKEKLQGTWKVVTIEEKGQSKEQDDAQFVFDGDEFAFKNGGQVLHKGKFKLDPSKDPKAIDLEITESIKEFEGKTGLSIYAWDKDDKDALKLCLGRPGETDRPKEFAGAAGTARWSSPSSARRSSRADGMTLAGEPSGVIQTRWSLSYRITSISDHEWC